MSINQNFCRTFLQKFGVNEIISEYLLLYINVDEFTDRWRGHWFLKNRRRERWKKVRQRVNVDFKIRLELRDDEVRESDANGVEEDREEEGDNDMWDNWDRKFDDDFTPVANEEFNDEESLQSDDLEDF